MRGVWVYELYVHILRACKRLQYDAHQMQTKAQKLVQLLREEPVTEGGASRSHTQGTFQRKLDTDISRTKKFLDQANAAIEKLAQQDGPMPDQWDGGACDAATLPPGWTPETAFQAHLLSLHEVYAQLPYQPMKNDSIGVATAYALTSDSVDQQSRASTELSARGAKLARTVEDLKSILADYKLADQLIQERIHAHPERMAILQQKLENLTTSKSAAARKLDAVHAAADGAKALEARLHQHLQRVIMKLYAMLDWENKHAMDEQTFKRSLSRSATLVKSLVAKLASGTDDKWITVERNAPEKRLVDILVRNDILLIRETPEIQVRLRDYGLP